jgi:hypothetical protein
MGGETRENWTSALAPSGKRRTGPLSADEVYDHGKDGRIADEREDCVSEDHPPIRGAVTATSGTPRLIATVKEK